MGNQIGALQDTIKKLQQELYEANQQKLATKRKMEEMLSPEKNHENTINDINKKWSKRMKIMEKILSNEKQKFRIYKNIWKQKQLLYQNNNMNSWQPQLSSDSSSSEDNNDDCDEEDITTFSNRNKRNYNVQCRSTDGKKHASGEVEDQYGHVEIDGDLSLTSLPSREKL